MATPPVFQFQASVWKLSARHNYPMVQLLVRERTYFTLQEVHESAASAMAETDTGGGLGLLFALINGSDIVYLRYTVGGRYFTLRGLRE